MADVNRILQVEMIGDGLQIVCVMVHVVPVAGLSRATMSAAISCNAAIAFAEEEKHLRVPVIRRQRPTMAEDDGLSAAPIFVINVDISSVFFSNSDVRHGESPFGLDCTRNLLPVAELARSNLRPSGFRRHVKFL